MVFSILLQIPIGLLLATFLDALGKKANAFKIVWFFPYLMSSVAIAFLFTYALATNGGIFSELASLIAGKNVTWTCWDRNPQALYTVIGVMAWQFYALLHGLLHRGVQQYRYLHLRGGHHRRRQPQAVLV